MSRPLFHIQKIDFIHENVLVYLSNAIEKTCKEENFPHEGIWHKWGPYGFEQDGRLRFEEYYPNALEDTYKGVSGYIYSCSQIEQNHELEIGTMSLSKREETGC